MLKCLKADSGFAAFFLFGKRESIEHEKDCDNQTDAPTENGKCQVFIHAGRTFVVTKSLQTREADVNKAMDNKS